MLQPWLSCVLTWAVTEQLAVVAALVHLGLCPGWLELSHRGLHRHVCWLELSCCRLIVAVVLARNAPQLAGAVVLLPPPSVDIKPQLLSASSLPAHVSTNYMG